MKPIHIFALLLIVLAGAFIRFHDLGEESLWMDEGYAFSESDTETLSETLSNVTQPPEGTPPLYFMLLHGWMKLTDTSDFNIRFISAFFSTLAIIMIFLLGREIGNPRVGLYSAGLLSFSMIHLVYAQEARPYGLFTFLLISSLLLFVRLGKNKKWTVPYILATVFMLYTHYLSFFILLLQNIIVFATKQKLKMRSWIMIQLTIAVLYIPGFWVISRQFAGLNRTIQVSLGLKLGLPLFIANLGIFNFLIPAAIIVLILFILRPKIDLKRIWLPDRIFFFASLFLLLIGFLVFPEFMRSTFLTRYTHFAFPIFYVLIARQFDRLEGKTIISILFILLAVLSISWYHSVDRKIGWEDGVRFIETKDYPTDMIIVINDIEYEIFRHYYTGPGPAMSVTIYPEMAKNLAERDRLIEELEDTSSLWFVWPEEYKTEGIYHKYFFNSFFVNDSAKYKDLEIYHLVRKDAISS